MRTSQHYIARKYTYLRGGPWVLACSLVTTVVNFINVVSTESARGHRMAFAEVHRLGSGSVVVDGVASDSGAGSGSRLVAEVCAEVSTVGL